MENKLIGTKGKDLYNGWFLPLNTWTTILKMYSENGDIKIWKRTINSVYSLGLESNKISQLFKNITHSFNK